jgi:hypothetical protein
LTHSENLNPAELKNINNKNKEVLNTSREKPNFISGNKMNLKEASELVKNKLADALDKVANATITISKDQDIWRAEVEIVEEEYVPGEKLRSMNDIIGLYDVEMDSSGELLRWLKKKTYKRGAT